MSSIALYAAKEMVERMVAAAENQRLRPLGRDATIFFDMELLIDNCRPEV